MFQQARATQKQQPRRLANLRGVKVLEEHSLSWEDSRRRACRFQHRSMQAQLLHGVAVLPWRVGVVKKNRSSVSIRNGGICRRAQQYSPTSHCQGSFHQKKNSSRRHVFGNVDERFQPQNVTHSIAGVFAFSSEFNLFLGLLGSQITINDRVHDVQGRRNADGHREFKDVAAGGCVHVMIERKRL